MTPDEKKRVWREALQRLNEGDEIAVKVALEDVPVFEAAVAEDRLRRAR
ncbi:MAG: hypothetical protein ABSF28_07715 [Terracidiphilus sp.]|jgi:intein/homing endonuclease